jgi:hypothetical protein
MMASAAILAVGTLRGNIEPTEGLLYYQMLGGVVRRHGDPTMPDRQAIDAAMANTPPEDAALPRADHVVDRRPWQFSLRAMMIFTAAVAGVVWLATIKGAGVLVVVVGLSVSTLNWRGGLAGWQRPERCGRPIKLGWLLLAISLLLPSVRGCNNTGMLGCDVAIRCANAQVAGIARTDFSKKQVFEYAFITLMNLTNILLLASPLLLALLRRGRGQYFTTILACGATAAWTLPVPDASGLLIGYYVWCLGQVMVLSAARLGPRTLAAMAAVAFVRVFLWPAP